MSLANRVMRFFDISRDIDHFDEKWYSQQLRGEAEDINRSTIYSLTQILPRLPVHFFRGALVGGAAGLIVSTFTNEIDHIEIGMMAGVVDWTQYGIRILRKVYRARS